METGLLSVSTELAKVICGNCGGVYAIAERYRKQQQEQGGFWTCPYCKTGWGFCESENDRLKKQLAQQKALVQNAELGQQNALKEADHFRKKHQKILNRIEKGVCPHCHRYFKNLHRHINTKHKIKK